jgi:nucleoside-diphosphate-sugar epimerase
LSDSAEVIEIGLEPGAGRRHKFRYADLSSGAIDDGLLEGVDGVVHAAGIAHVFRLDESSAALMDKVNGEGAGRMARCAAHNGVRRFVLVSSVSVYGGAEAREVDEGMPCEPAGAYAKSKHKGELLVRQALEGAPESLSIVRPVTLYGEGDRGNVLRLIRMIDSGRFIWIGGGRNMKSLMHVDDAGRGCALAALDLNGSGGTWNLGGSPETMREIVETIAAGLGRRSPRLSIPAPVARAGAAVAARCGARGRSIAGAVGKWLSHDAYDCRAFQTRFSFAPEVSLAEGIRREVGWYRALSGGAS